MANHKEAIKAFDAPIRSGTTDSVLSRMFRSILNDLGLVEVSKFNEIISRYIIKMKVPLNLYDTTLARGNLSKELRKSTMTWRTFVKGLIVMNVWMFEIKLTLHHRNGKITEHKTVCDLSNVSIETEGEEK
jgi:hypothetical protein